MLLKCSFSLFLILASFSSHSSELWKKIKTIKLSDPIEKVKSAFGDFRMVDNFYVIDHPEYELRRSDQEKIFSINLKKELLLNSLPEASFEFIAPLRRGPDIILGSIVGLPDQGLILEVFNNGQIQRVSWTKEWKVKKAMTKKQIIENLGQGRISQ